MGIVLVVYAPALDGAFVSDDQHYVWGNPYVRDATPANVREILDPQGAVVPLVENYAPVHLLLQRGDITASNAQAVRKATSQETPERISLRRNSSRCPVKGIRSSLMRRILVLALLRVAGFLSP